MKLPCNKLFCAFVPVMVMPLPPLNPITLAAGRVSPPIMFDGEFKIVMPSTLFFAALVPVMSVPKKLPSTTLSAAPPMNKPEPLLPLLTLPAPTFVPPMKFPEALVMVMPLPPTWVGWPVPVVFMPMILPST